MGCTNEKMVVKVSPASAGSSLVQKDNLKSKQLDNQIGASSSSLNNGDRPAGSATSKVSKRSQDSGYSANDLEDDHDIDDYANIITENSDGAVVEEIEQNFKPQELGMHYVTLTCSASILGGQRGI